ncbi:MAG: APC family permease [Isosphaeraceae bacterium]
MLGTGTTEATSREDGGHPIGHPISGQFGLVMAIFVVISSMVGVGVLTTSGYTIAAVGSSQVMLGLWLVGGMVAVCGALTVAELSASLPASGGEYIYLYDAYGPLVAFLSGWVSFLIGFAAPIAASAYAAASYLLAPLDLHGPMAKVVHQGIATLAISVFAIIHTSDRGRTIWVQSSFTLLKLGFLISFVVAGLAVGWRHRANLVDRPPLGVGAITPMIFALVYIYYSYSGWNAAAYLAGEISDPGRRLPKAILIGTLAVVVLYLGLNTVYALALPAPEIRRIAEREGLDAVAPFAELAARRLFGPMLAAPLSIVIGLALMASLSAYILTGPRVSYAMAQAGHFPAIAGRLTRRSRTPAVATALQGWMGLGTSLDRIVREHPHLYRCRPGSVLDAVRELDIRLAPDTPRPATSVSHARLSVRSSYLLSSLGHPDYRGLRRAALGFALFIAQHPGGHPGLFSMPSAQASDTLSTESMIQAQDMRSRFLSHLRDGGSNAFENP